MPKSHRRRFDRHASSGSRNSQRAARGLALAAGVAIVGFAVARWAKDARARGVDSDFVDDAPATTGRGAKKRDAAGRGGENAIITRSVTINRPRGEVYAFWRDFSNLAGVMENVDRIDVLDDKHSHWVVKAPAGRTVEWDAVVTEDVPDELIAWEAAPGASVRNSGRIQFIDASPGRGTLVRATIAYDPPGGVVGEWVAKLLQREPNLQARRDLRRLKQFLETGEVTTSASPSARRSESPTQQAF